MTPDEPLSMLLLLRLGTVLLLELLRREPSESNEWEKRLRLLRAVEAWEITVASSAVEAWEYDDEGATDNVMVQIRIYRTESRTDRELESLQVFILEGTSEILRMYP